MNHRERRNVKKGWRRIPPLSFCDVTIHGFELPNTIFNFDLKVNDCMLARCNLDYFQNLRLYLIVVVDGFPYLDRRESIYLRLFSDEEIEGLLGESDEDFVLIGCE